MPILTPSPKNIATAVTAIQSGECVILPTETVYGLAADATNNVAVAKIFTAKGRPSNHPLIVHVAYVTDARRATKYWPVTAQRLAKAFWPGPLTLVLPKSDWISSAATGGLDSVAVRIPRHPVFLSVLRRCRLPLAAPSANPHTKLSPTQVQHLDPGLLESVASVLDGGPCQIGLESTVLDLCSPTPILLRPGVISRAEIESVIGKIDTAKVGAMTDSPGMMARHYQPRAQLVLAERLSADQPGLVFSKPNALQIQMPPDPVRYAQLLYDALFRMDLSGVPTVFIESPPMGDEWVAVWDRLRRASAT